MQRTEISDFEPVRKTEDKEAAKKALALRSTLDEKQDSTNRCSDDDEIANILWKAFFITLLCAVLAILFVCLYRHLCVKFLSVRQRSTRYRSELCKPEESSRMINGCQERSFTKQEHCPKADHLTKASYLLDEEHKRDSNCYKEKENIYLQTLHQEKKNLPSTKCQKNIITKLVRRIRKSKQSPDASTLLDEEMGVKEKLVSPRIHSPALIERSSLLSTSIIKENISIATTCNTLVDTQNIHSSNINLTLISDTCLQCRDLRNPAHNTFYLMKTSAPRGHIKIHTRRPMSDTECKYSLCSPAPRREFHFDTSQDRTFKLIPIQSNTEQYLSVNKDIKNQLRGDNIFKDDILLDASGISNATRSPKDNLLNLCVRNNLEQLIQKFRLNSEASELNEKQGQFKNDKNSGDAAHSGFNNTHPGPTLYGSFGDTLIYYRSAVDKKNEESLKRTELNEMYDELGMLFSFCMKQQARLCQKKYCVLTRNLKRQKHDEKKCQLRFTYCRDFHKTIPCSTASVCNDAYDEFKLMKVSPKDRKRFYEGVYERRRKCLNQSYVLSHCS